MISSVWVAVGLSIGIPTVSFLGAWYVSHRITEYKTKQLEDARISDNQKAALARKEDREAAKADRDLSAKQIEALTCAIGNLDKAIRDSVAAVGNEIKGLLFNANDAGRPFYQRVDDCRNAHKECAEEFDDRLISLEAKAHTHEANRM